MTRDKVTRKVKEDKVTRKRHRRSKLQEKITEEKKLLGNKPGDGREPGSVMEGYEGPVPTSALFRRQPYSDVSLIPTSALFRVLETKQRATTNSVKHYY